jgi:hypothetical protein
LFNDSLITQQQNIQRKDMLVGLASVIKYYRLGDIAIKINVFTVLGLEVQCQDVLSVDFW